MLTCNSLQTRGFSFDGSISCLGCCCFWWYRISSCTCKLSHSRKRILDSLGNRLYALLSGCSPFFLNWMTNCVHFSSAWYLARSWEAKGVLWSPTSYKIWFSISLKTVLIVLTAGTRVSLFPTWLTTTSKADFTLSRLRCWLYHYTKLHSWRSGYWLSESATTFSIPGL